MIESTQEFSTAPLDYSLLPVYSKEALIKSIENLPDTVPTVDGEVMIEYIPVLNKLPVTKKRGQLFKDKDGNILKGDAPEKNNKEGGLKWNLIEGRLWTREEIIWEIKSGNANGIGLRTDLNHGRFTALDRDGEAAQEKSIELGGVTDSWSWKSGKPGRDHRVFYLPKSLGNVLTGIDIKTGAKGDDGKEQLLELRLASNKYSVLPFSYHPDTKRAYVGIYGIEALTEPDQWIIDKLILNFSDKNQKIAPKTVATTERTYSFDRNSGDFDPEFTFAAAKYALTFIDPRSKGQGTYPDALEALQALHGEYGDSSRFWELVNGWSPSQGKGTDWDLDQKVKGFDPNGKRKIGTLFDLAKRDTRFNWKDVPYRSKGYKSNSPSGIPQSRKEQKEADKPTESLEVALDRLIAENLPTSQVLAKLSELASLYEMYPSVAEKIYKERKSEVELKQDLEDGRDNFEELIRIDSTSIDIAEILPSVLAEGLKAKAQIIGVDPARTLQPLLPMCGAMLGSKVQIVLIEGTYSETANFNTVDIAPPSSGKSANESVISEPIKEMKRAARKAREKLQNSQEGDDPKSAKLPPARAYVFSEGRLKTIFSKVASQPPRSGSVISRDELVGLFLGTETKTGDGDERQILLSSWNGGGMSNSVDRMDAAGTQSYHFDYQTINIMGGIQPQKAAACFDAQKDIDGMMSRFLPAVAVIPDNFGESPDFSVDISDITSKLLRTLDGIECELDSDDFPKARRIRLAPDALKLWQRYKLENKTEQKRRMEDQPGYAAYLGKQDAHTARFALFIHCVEWALSSDNPQLYDLERNIPISCVERAIKLSRYYINQYKKLAAIGETDNEQKLEGILKKIYDLSLSRGSVTVADLVQRLKKTKLDGRFVDKNTIVEMVKHLVDMGYGTTQPGKRSDSFIFTPKRKIVPSGVSQYQDSTKEGTTESLPSKGLDPSGVSQYQKSKIAFLDKKGEERDINPTKDNFLTSTAPRPEKTQNPDFRENGTNLPHLTSNQDRATVSESYLQSYLGTNLPELVLSTVEIPTKSTSPRFAGVKYPESVSPETLWLFNRPLAEKEKKQ